MEPIKVGLIGLGTVGAGLAELFFHHGPRLDRRLGRPIRLTRIADLDTTTDRGVRIPEGVLTASAREVLADPEIRILVELAGGLDEAKEFVLAAIDSGKQVVTANKALLAIHGAEIFARAEAAKIGIFFEGAVAGGIPLIRSFREGLAANRVKSICGILNGTSNYILSRMTYQNEPYAQALAAAQAEGLAEADPSLDVEGMDAAHKLAIMVSMAFGGRIEFGDLPVEGIDRVEDLDIAMAREFGFVIKLLALARRVGKRIDARVHPAMLPKSHVLAAVGGVFNAIHVTADPVGEVLFYGLGAGRRPTASAVAADVLEAARNIILGVGLRVPNLGEPGLTQHKLALGPDSSDQILARYYIRLNVLDQPGVLSKVSGVLADDEISIQSVSQKGQGEASVPVVIITHQTREDSIRRAMERLMALEVLARRPVRYRIEDEV